MDAQMGSMRHIRDNTSEFAAGAIVFWGIAGAAVGIVAAMALSFPAVPAFILAFVAGVLGLCVGFYAAWGGSRLARVLAVPGAIIELIPH
jgi:cbb3-type cytochrome oxidase subunit 1